MMGLVLFQESEESKALTLSCEDAKRRWLSIIPEEGLHQESNHADILILNFQPPELLKVLKCLLFK